MLDQAMVALGTMIDRLRSAVDFSNARNNGGGCDDPNMTLAQATEFYQAAQREHEQWHRDFREALESFNASGFPAGDRWNWVDISTPQVAFSTVPHVFHEGERLDRVQIFGAGECYEGGRSPEDENPLCPGEVLTEDQVSPDVYVYGLFDDNEVRWWEEVLTDMQDTVRRVSEMAFVQRFSTTVLDNEFLKRALKGHRPVGRPTEFTVAERRKVCADERAKNKTQGQIAQHPAYRGNVELVKSDLQWHRDKKRQRRRKVGD